MIPLSSKPDGKIFRKDKRDRDAHAALALPPNVVRNIIYFHPSETQYGDGGGRGSSVACFRTTQLSVFGRRWENIAVFFFIYIFFVSPFDAV